MKEAPPNGWTFRRTRVLVPDFTEEDLSWLQNNEPFAVLAELEEGAVFVGMTEIPTIQSILGLPSPSGLYAYAYQVDPNADELEPYLFSVTVVGEKVALPSIEQSHIVSWTNLGALSTNGLLCSHMAFRGPGIIPFSEEFAKKGCRIIKTKDYTPPMELLDEALRRRTAR